MDPLTSLFNKQARTGAVRPRRSVLITIGALVGLAVAVLVVLKLLSMYGDWLWFGEVKLRVVFWQTFLSQLVTGVVFGLLFFVIVWGNVELARRLVPRLRPVGEDTVEYAHEALYQLVGRVALAALAVIAIIVGYSVSGSWMTFQRALNASSFGAQDPVFHHDLGFYIFSVPAWHYLQSFIFACVLASMALAAVIHFVLGGIDFKGASFTMEQGRARIRRPQLSVHMPARAVAHLSALLGAAFVITAAGQLFKAWDMLLGSSGVVYGAGYTDVHARLPVARILMGLALLLAAALFWNVWRRRQWWPLTIAVWVVALLLLQFVFPAVMQGLFVSPNQLAKERPYIANNMSATRAAYDLASISGKSLANAEALTVQQLNDNQLTLRNIRLWDADTLVTSYRQLQELRPYYSFTDADVDRYVVDGVLRQTMLSARELNISGLPSTAQTWVNQHITYTHGYGVALSAVNQVTTDGSPDFLVKNIPPQSAPELTITQPRIYYGEIGTDYTLVNTNQKEFDFPGGTGDEYTTYKGSGGVSISGFFNRLAFCWRYRTIKFFTASAITSQSKLIIRNNIKTRLSTVAPFLSFDKDPYMVIAGGNLYWIVDGYTTTNLYPYSQPQSGVNYIRNSVKAVVDAYNGTVTLYIFDDKDPLLRTYERIFPGMFTPASKMPADLRRHVRYPEGYFNIQAHVFDTYHVTDPAVLYNKGDQWQVPDNVALSGPGEMQAYYVIMRLPGEQQEEFLLMLPFVPNGRSNMVSWLGARSDAPNYGKAVSIAFSKSSNIYGPSQVEAAINQDPKVSQQLTLWNQSGSTAIMGNLLVVPIEKALLYVQPLYLQAEQTKLPQLKEVIVFYQSPEGGTSGVGQVVAMQPTLSQALTDIFGSAPPVGPTPSPTPSPGGPTPTPGPTTTPAPGALSAQARALIQQANKEFETAQAALKAGDFAEYGRQVEALKATLSKLQALQ